MQKKQKEFQSDDASAFYGLLFGKQYVFLVKEKYKNRQIPFLHSTRWIGKRKNEIYNVEFDPGSGWTLATGLTHASRGAADT